MGRFHDEATTVLLICFLSKCHLNIEIENASAYTPGSKANGREAPLCNVSVLTFFCQFSFGDEMSLKRTQAHRGCTRRFAGLSVSHCGLMHSVPYHHAAVIFTCCSVSA